MDLKRSKLVSA